MFTVNQIIDILNGISSFISALLIFRIVFFIVGIFTTRKFPKAKKNHKYAVLIAARNEQMVIGNLIESIHAQDYPAELIDIFVVADNCEDQTAEVSRKCGAICYERHDLEHRTKGFALQYLVECIRHDYGIDAYEGYFIFDADNLLKQDFISKMNDSFDAGEKIVTSYRNTKNFDDNWIAASYGIHWLRTIRTEHRARSLFHLATRIQGTGFLFSWEVIKDGWNYTSLTEDRAFCVDAVANGYKISYNDEAEFYDEQPVDIKTAIRQRIRWSKGHLQAFTEKGGKIFAHIFYTGGAANRPEIRGTTGPIPFWRRFFNNIRLRFMSLDMLGTIYPRNVLLLLKKIIIYILRVCLICTTGLIITQEYAPGFVSYIYDTFGITTGEQTILQGALLLVLFGVAESLTLYFGSILMAFYVFFIERKRIMKIKWYKKIWFALTFPIFDLLTKITMYIALFTKVEWKPTPHNSSMTISELNKRIALSDSAK